MNTFTDSFWSLFIIVITLGALLFCYLLLQWNSHGERTPDGTVKTMGHVWDEDLEELNNPLPRWWLIMFYVTLVFAILYLVLYPGLGSATGFFNWSSTGQYEAEMARADARYGPIFDKFVQTPVETLAADADAVRVGSRLYSAYCTGCHGSDAAGNTGFPNLRDDYWQWGSTGDDIKHSILEGRTAAMPAWAEPLGGDEGVANVTQHVMRLAGMPHDEAKAEAGAPQYKTFCAACHGDNGEGHKVPGAPRLNDDKWIYGANEASITTSIAMGRNGKMPPHRELLGESKSHVLAAYVYSLSREQ